MSITAQHVLGYIDYFSRKERVCVEQLQTVFKKADILGILKVLKDQGDIEFRKIGDVEFITRPRVHWQINRVASVAISSLSREKRPAPDALDSGSQKQPVVELIEEDVVSPEAEAQMLQHIERILTEDWIADLKAVRKVCSKWSENYIQSILSALHKKGKIRWVGFMGLEKIVLPNTRDKSAYVDQLKVKILNLVAEAAEGEITTMNWVYNKFFPLVSFKAVRAAIHELIKNEKLQKTIGCKDIILSLPPA